MRPNHEAERVLMTTAHNGEAEGREDDEFRRAAFVEYLLNPSRWSGWLEQGDNRTVFDEVLNEEASRLEAEWRVLRNFGTAHATVEICLAFDRPLPAWAKASMREAMTVCWKHGGSGGRGKRGTYRKQAKRIGIRRRQHDLVAAELASMTLEAACEKVSIARRGKTARGSASVMKKAFRRHRNEQAAIAAMRRDKI